MKRLIYLLAFSLFFSCATKKTITEFKEIVVKDTITEFKDRIVTKAITDTLFVENPCDSLGLLKDFKQTINTGSAKIVLENKKGNIQATVNIDSLVNSKIAVFKSNYKTEKEYVDKEVIKWKTPFWIIICLLISAILNVVLLRISFFK